MLMKRFEQKKLLAWSLRRTAVHLRVRHFRGHGVHSPFAYRLVRDVFMKRHHLHASGALYDALRDLHVGKNTARMAQAVYDYAACRGFDIDRFADDVKDGMWCCLASSVPVSATGCRVVALLHPRASRERYRQCLEAVGHHAGLSLDCRCILFLFNDRGLSKEHIKL